MEREMILRTLEEAGGNRTRSAEILGDVKVINRCSLNHHPLLFLSTFCEPSNCILSGADEW
jgi:hypothetical protein